MITSIKKKKVFISSTAEDLSARIIGKRKVEEKSKLNSKEIIKKYDVLTIELACFLDQRVLLDEKISDIKVYISDTSLEEMRQRRDLVKEALSPSSANESGSALRDRRRKRIKRETGGDKKRRQKQERAQANSPSSREIRSNLATAIFDIDNLNQNLMTSRVSNLRFLTKIDVNQILGPLKIKNIQNIMQKDEDLFGFRETYEIRRVRSPKFRTSRNGTKTVSDSIPVSGASIDEFSLSRFKRNYFNQIKLGIDPIQVFSKKDDFMSVEDRLSGTMSISKERYSELRQSFKEYAKESISNNAESDLGFKINKRKKINRNRICKTTFEMSRPKIVTLAGSTGFLNLVFFAFDKDGRRVDSYEKRVSPAELFLTEVNPTIDFSTNAIRTSKGNVITSISNQELQDSYFNLYQKEFSRSQNFMDAVFKEESEDFLIKAKNTARLIDGKLKNPSTPLFSKTKTVFHRITANFAGKEIANTKSSSIASLESEGRQLSCSIYVMQDDEEGTSEISISNLSEDVYAVLPVKRVARGTRGSNFETVKYLLDGSLVDNVKTFVRDMEEGESLETSFKFSDGDVEDDVIYEYAAILYSRSGQKQISGSRFLEKRIDREGLIEAEATLTPRSVNIYDEKDNKIKSVVDFEVLLKRSEDDVDKIINSIFGDNRSLFNSDLESIKDASNLIYGVRVHRIDMKTGEYVYVGSFRGYKQEDENASAQTDIPKTYRVTFSDNAPAFTSQTYKFDPYIIPPSQVLDKVFNSLEKIVKDKNRSRSTLNKMAVSKQKILNKDILSKVGTKFASIQGRKGAISSPAAFLEKNKNDLFLEGITGDIVYESFIPEKEKISFQKVSLQESNVRIIKGLDRDARNKNYIPKQIANIEFSISDGDVMTDFYVIVKQINKDPNIIIDGAVHSQDALGSGTKITTYNYLSEVKTRVGLIRYYLFGISKTGIVNGPSFLGSLLLEGE
jgi:hypothetical protein